MFIPTSFPISLYYKKTATDSGSGFFTIYLTFRSLSESDTNYAGSFLHAVYCKALPFRGQSNIYQFIHEMVSLEGNLPHHLVTGAYMPPPPDIYKATSNNFILKK